MEFSTGILEFRANIDQISQDINRLIGLIGQLQSAGTEISAKNIPAPYKTLEESAVVPKSLEIDLAKADVRVLNIEKMKNQLNIQLQKEISNVKQDLKVVIPTSIQTKDADTASQAQREIGANVAKLSKLSEQVVTLKDITHTTGQLTSTMKQFSVAMTDVNLKSAEGRQAYGVLANAQEVLAQSLEKLNLKQQATNISLGASKQAISDSKTAMNQINRDLISEKRKADAAIAAEDKKAKAAALRREQAFGSTINSLNKQHTEALIENEKIKAARLASTSKESQRKQADYWNRQRRESEQAAKAAAQAAQNDQTIGGASFNKKLDAAIERMIIYRAAFTALHKTVLELKDTIQVFKDIDYRLAQIGKVLPEVGADFELMKNTAFKMGKQFGVSINEILDSMKTWAQLGLTQNQTLIATEAALLAVNTTGLSAVEVTNALTAAIFAYNIAVEDAVGVIDKFMAVQANFAITSGDIAKSMFATGSAANEMGVSLDQLAGLTAAIGTTTRQTGREIGNALKTIFARMARPETIKVFQELGVAVYKSKGQFRSFFDVLNDAAEAWRNLDDAGRANLGQTAAGVRRYVQFIALMENFSIAQRAAIVSENSMGAATRANQLEMQTFSKSLEVLSVITDELKFNIGQNLVKPLTVLIDVFKWLTQGTVGKFFAGFATVITGLGVTFLILRGSILAVELVLRKLAITSIPATTAQMGALSGAMATVGVTSRGAAAGIAAVGTATKFALGPLNAIILAVSLAVGVFSLVGRNVKKFGEDLEFVIKTDNELIKSLFQSVEGYKKEMALLNGLVASREKLTKEMEKSSKNTKELTRARADLALIDNQISTASVELSSVLKTLNSLQSTQAEITEALSSKLSELAGRTDELVQSQGKLLGQKILDFWMTYGANVDLAKNKISSIRTDISNFYNRIGSVKKITLFDATVFSNIKDTQTLLKQFANQFGVTASDIKKELTVTGFGVREIIDVAQVKAGAGQSLNVIKKFLEDINEANKSTIDPELQKKIQDQYNFLINTVEKASTRIGTLSTDEGMESYSDSVARLFQSVVDEVKRGIVNFGEVTNPVLQAALDQLVSIEKAAAEIDNFRNQGGDDSYIPENYIDMSKVTDKYASKLISLNQILEQGRARIEAFFSIGLKSGSKLESMASQLASYFESSFKSIQTGIFQTEDELLILKDQVKRLENADTSLISADQEAMQKHREKIELAKADVTEAQNYLTVLLGLLKIEGYRLTLTKQLNEEQKKLSDNVFRTSTEMKSFQDISKSIVEDMKRIGYSQRVVLDAQKAQLNSQVDLIKAQAMALDATEREVFIRNEARRLTEEQLKILKEIASIEVARSINLLSTGASDFVSALKEGLESIPDVLQSSFQKRKDLTEDLKDAEKDLQAARLEGDHVAEQTAQTTIKNLKKELHDYRAGWIEVKTVIESITTGISDAAFKNIADQFADAIADVQVGGNTIGQAMGKAISGQFDLSVSNLIEQQKTINQDFTSSLLNIYNGFLISLGEVLGKSVDIIQGPIQQEQLGPPTPVDGKDASERMKRAMKLGSIYAANVINRSIGQAGGQLGQTLAGVFQIAGSTIFEKFAGTVLGGGIIGIGAGILGGLLGSLFGGDEKPKNEELQQSLSRNTDAIEANTIAVKEFSQGIFNAPPRFLLAPYSGNITTGASRSGPINVNINIPQNAHLNVEDVAQEVARVLEGNYSSDVTRTRTRASNFI